jgi:hypothetical protein
LAIFAAIRRASSRVSGLANVRFTLKSGHRLSVSGCPHCAKSGHERFVDQTRVGNA